MVETSAQHARWVFFDYDGTLSDTAPAILSTAREVLREWGMPDVDSLDLRGLLGPPFPEGFEQVLGLSRADAEEVTRRYRARFADGSLEAHALFEGIPELLGALEAQGQTLAVVSSRRRPKLMSMLEMDGILGHFGAVVGQTEEANLTKAQLIAVALRALGARADETVMVGDRHFDIEGAAAQGLASVGCAFDAANEGELREAGATWVVGTVPELASVLLGPALGERAWEAHGWRAGGVVT